MSLDHDWTPKLNLPDADFSAVRGRASALRLDPSLGSLSLGLSTLEAFDFNSFALTPAHHEAIPDVAGKLTTLLQRMPGGHVTVTGHTDAVGGEKDNAKLGLNRAEAARDALVEAGVPAVAIRVASEGESAPVVPSRAAEPRNRRVEVRFNDELVLPGARSARLLSADELRLGPAPLIDLTPKSGPLTPALFPPFTPGLQPVPKQTPAVNPGPQPSRKAGPGDVFKALIKVPSVESWLERKLEEHANEFKAMPAGDQAFTVGAGVSMATLAAIGISTDPAASKLVLDMLDGAELPVPGVPWLKVKAFTKGGGVGAGLTLELSHFVKELK